MTMRYSLKRFCRGFVYAVNGIAFTIRTQRNFRFHLSVMIWVLVFSRFYDLSRIEYAVLMLTFSSVLTAEAVNTALEQAADLAAKGKKNEIAGRAKDAAAGAVLISALFSAAVAFFMFWDIAVFGEIYVYFTENIFALIALAVMSVITFIFIFKG